MRALLRPRQRGCLAGGCFGGCTAVVGRRKRKLLQTRRYRSGRGFKAYRFVGRLRSDFGSGRRCGGGYADNYTDIFGDGSASFVIPQGNTEYVSEWLYSPAQAYSLFTTGKESDGSALPNLKLKDINLVSVAFNDRYIGKSMPFFITSDGENTIGQFNKDISIFSVLGDGSLTVKSSLNTTFYTQYGGNVTMTDSLDTCCIFMYKGSLTVTGDAQALNMSEYVYSFYPIGVRMFTGSSAQDAEETTEWQVSPEMQELLRRCIAGETLTAEEYAAMNSESDKQCEAMLAQLSGKTMFVSPTPGMLAIFPEKTARAIWQRMSSSIMRLSRCTGRLFTRMGHTQIGWATIDGGERFSVSKIFTPKTKR